MSSLLRKRSTQGRPAPGKMWLGGLVALGLLSTVLSLAAAGTARPSGTASLTTAAASTAQRAAAPAKAAAAPHSMGSAGALAAVTTKQVDIMNYTYSPATLTINVGDTVTWTNMDTAPHTVTVTSGPVKFKSPNLAKGESFTYTFTEAGTYDYYCAVHPDMVAKVVVKGSGSTPTPTPTPSPDPEPEPTEEPSPTMPPMPAACGGLEAAVDAFMQHFYAAHLETSLLQQAQDALAVDQYVKTHTVLIENMLKPLLGGLQSSVDTFLEHVYAAHLETSPTQQVADALALDQYIKTHTVMIENMVKPLVGGTSSC